MDSNAGNSIISYAVAAFLIVILPASIIYVLVQPLDRLNEEEFNNRWIKVFENIKLTKTIFLTYRLWFIIRRIIFIGSIFIFAKNFTIQYLCLLYTNLLLTIYQGQFKPFIQKKSNRIELSNEFFMSLASYQVIFFTDMVEDLHVRYKYGWALIIIVSISIVSNMGIVFHMIIKQVFLITIKVHKVTSKFVNEKVNNFVKSKVEEEPFKKPKEVASM